MKKIMTSLLMTVLFLSSVPVQRINAIDSRKVVLIDGSGTEVDGFWRARFKIEPYDPDLVLTFSIDYGLLPTEVGSTYSESDHTHTIEIDLEKDVVPLFGPEFKEENDELQKAYELALSRFESSCDVNGTSENDNETCRKLRSDFETQKKAKNNYIRENIGYTLTYRNADFEYGYLDFGNPQEFYNQSEHFFEVIEDNQFSNFKLKEDEYLIHTVGYHDLIGSDNYAMRLMVYPTHDVYIQSLVTYLNGIPVVTQEFEKVESYSYAHPITELHSSFSIYTPESLSEETYIIKDQYLKLMSEEQINGLESYNSANYTVRDFDERLRILNSMFSFDMTLVNQEGKKVVCTFMDPSAITDAMTAGLVVNFDHVNNPKHNEKILVPKEPEQLDYDASILPKTGHANSVFVEGVFLILSGIILKRKQF